MQKEYIDFVRKIYNYCDNNIGEKALFPVFVNLWEEDCPKAKTDLAVMASTIISKLIDKNVLIEIPKYERFHVPYGLYKILPHEKLIRMDDIAQKRMNLFK